MEIGQGPYMRRYLVCSDIHGCVWNYELALEQAGHIDAIMIAGDVGIRMSELMVMTPNIPVYAVAGNNDMFQTHLPKWKVVTEGRHRIFMAHGHMHGIYMHFDVIEKDARKNNCDIVIFGHTHRYYMAEKNGILFLNPGALKGMARYSYRTYMVLEFEDDGNFHVIEGKIQD